MSFPLLYFASAAKSLGWTPNNLTGLLGLYETNGPYCFADAGKATPCANGTGIYTWVGRAGPDLVQATAANRATFTTGTNRAVYDGGDNYGLWPTGSPAGLFSFHRFKTSTLGYHNIYDNTSLVGVMLWIDNFGKLEPDAGAAVWTNQAASTDGAWHTVFVWRSLTEATRLWRDGTEITPDVPRTPQTVPANLDLFSRGGASGFDGSISAFGFASALPSTAQLANLQAYLTA